MMGPVDRKTHKGIVKEYRGDQGDIRKVCPSQVGIVEDHHHTWLPLEACNDIAHGKQIFSGTCFACHGTGAAGAPKAGDKSAWGPRIAKGKATLYQHALHGFTGKKGMMPAKGGNTGLSDADVKSAVDYMVSLAK